MTDDGRKDHPELIVPPILLPIGALAIALVLEWLVPVDVLSEPHVARLQTWLGIVAFLSGLAFVLSAISAFSDAETNVEPHKPALRLVTAPPYTMSRNPIYLGFILMHLGISLSFALEWGVVLFPILWLVLDRLIVVKEEAYLRTTFGADYEAFCKRTRRWF